MMPAPDPGPPVEAAVRWRPILAAAAGLLGVELVAVYRRAEEGGPASLVAASTDAIDALEPVATPGVGLLGEALEAGDVRLAREPASGLTCVAAAGLAAPKGERLGVLGLFAGPGGARRPPEPELIRFVAVAVALAVEDARTMERLRAADDWHRYLLDRLPDGVWAADEHGIFSYLSAGCERLLGYQPEELIGRSSQLIMHESTREAFSEGYRWQVAHPDGEQTYRVNLRHRDGHPVPVELHNIGTPAVGRYGGGQGSVREMSDRDRLEREIRDQAAELAAGRERERLAQELHDSVTQALFSMTLTAGAARMLNERGAPGVAAKLDELTALARDALAEMRSLIFELRPGSLAAEGLVAALRRYVAAVQGRSGLAIRVTVDPELPRLEIETEDALYRTAQEAIHNVVKHARAREARLEIGCEAGEVRMSIADDGKGFDPSLDSGGLGLRGLAARAERLGGSFAVTSEPGCGTTLAVRLPLRLRR